MYEVSAEINELAATYIKFFFIKLFDHFKKPSLLKWAALTFPI